MRLNALYLFVPCVNCGENGLQDGSLFQGFGGCGLPEGGKTIDEADGFQDSTGLTAGQTSQITAIGKFLLVETGPVDLAGQEKLNGAVIAGVQLPCWLL